MDPSSFLSDHSLSKPEYYSIHNYPNQNPVKRSLADNIEDEPLLPIENDLNSASNFSLRNNSDSNFANPIIEPKNWKSHVHSDLKSSSKKEEKGSNQQKINSSINKDKDLKTEKENYNDFLINPFLSNPNQYKIDKKTRESDASMGTLSKETEKSKDSTSVFLRENSSIVNEGSNCFTFNKNSKIDKSLIKQENDLKQELMRIMLQYEDLKKQNDYLQIEKKDQASRIKRLEEENSDLNRKIRDVNDINLNQTLSLNELESRLSIVIKENERLNSFLSNFLQNSNYFQETIHQNTDVFSNNASNNNIDPNNSIIPSTNRYFYDTLKYYKEELDQKIHLINQKNKEVESWKRNYEENEEYCKLEIEKLKKSLENATCAAQIKGNAENHSICEEKWQATQKELSDVKLKTELMEEEIKKIYSFLRKDDKNNVNHNQSLSCSSEKKIIFGNTSNMKNKNIQ